jgi:hypothetical protein
MFALPLHAQETFSLYVPSDHEEVKRMLKLADLRDGDVVFDLGSGDGRIVIQAAMMNPGVRGVGIEIDESLIPKSEENAKLAGVADRVKFLHQNVFDADLSSATVITMWLFPELMRLLRPKILAEARPGTRVITRTWDLGSWPPDAVDNEGVAVYKWIVPAKVGGYWEWTLPFGETKQAYAAIFEQWFQVLEGSVRAGTRRGVVQEMWLTGADLWFNLTMTIEGMGPVRHAFHGRVKGDVIEGTVNVYYKDQEKPVQLPWSARRVAKSDYFAPTGLFK